MSEYTDNAANEIADLALADEDATGDEKIVQIICDIMGASSQSLEEAYSTAIRVRRAERRARQILAERAAKRAEAANAPATPPEVGTDATPEDGPSEIS